MLSSKPPTPQQKPKQTTKKAKSTEEVAAEFGSLVLDESEVALLQELQTRWLERNQAWKDVSTPSWQHTQYRMLPLLVLPEGELLEEFAWRRDQYAWSDATAAQYWAAMRVAASTIAIVLPLWIKTQGKVLGFLVQIVFFS